MDQLFSIILAILALSFLIFIHELGHFFMARLEGMKVETFSIGFGRPIVSWKWQGVKWQIGWLLFGGYVRIAGTDVDKDQDLYQVKDGFFGKSPWARIKVSLMGPLVNIGFALLVFALLWVSGGREKNFSEYTLKSGWIDPQSELFMKGVRPGDEVWSLDGKPYRGMQDLIYVALTSSGPVEVKGAKVDYVTNEKTPFTYHVQPYPNPQRLDKGIKTIGLLAPANFLIYENSQGVSLPESSPIKAVDLRNGDRVVWGQGERIFSLQQLSQLINDQKVLVTVEREGKPILLRIPRVQVQELKFDNSFRDELIDWQFEAGLQGTKFPKLYVLPYNLSNNGVVEATVPFIDKEIEDQTFASTSDSEQFLRQNDRIIAVQGIPVSHSSEILKEIQEPKIYLIVQRNQEPMPLISWRDADHFFDISVSERDVQNIARSFGTNHQVNRSGSLILLGPITPKTHQEIYASSELYKNIEEEYQEQKRQIAAIEDPEKRQQLMELFEKRERKLELGVPIHDLKVEYNPIPTDQFMQAFNDIKRTLSALFGGTLNPKWMSGPVGIIQMFQEQSRSGLGDALYWLGVISLNLGVLNLLPIPMLDGGTIMLSLFEAITGYKIKPKTMEKLILPFAVLLIVFFIFLTYHDLSRLLGGFWKW